MEVYSENLLGSAWQGTMRFDMRDDDGGCNCVLCLREKNPRGWRIVEALWFDFALLRPIING